MQLVENTVILVLAIIFAWIIIANRKAKQAKKESIKGLEMVLVFILAIVSIIVHNS